jgi:hypothetical protein
MRIFLSFSFREKDRDQVNVVERLLSSHGARLVSGEALAGTVVTEAIKQRLLLADALVGLFTRRNRLADGTWTTHDWVRDEYIYVRSLNKPALALVEDGVKVGGVLQGQAFISLDRRTLLPGVLALSEVVGRWKEEFGQRQQDAAPFSTSTTPFY